VRLRPEILAVPESPLVRIATAAEAMPGSIKLCYGESDSPTPAFICRAGCDALRDGHTFYTHTAGTPALRASIAAKIHALHGAEYRPSEIMTTVGASMAIFIAIQALVGRGDNAVVVTPAYAIFANAVRIAGGEPRAVPLVRDGSAYRLDLDRVSRAIDPRTRLLVVNSPSNPTGWVISEEEQRALCDLATRHDVVILADEVYERIVFDQAIAPSFARVTPEHDRVIVVNSFSKTYNMTGWRLGWAQGSEWLIQAMYSAAEFMTSNPAAVSQQAGLVALRDGEPHVAALREQYAARRRQVVTALRAMPGVALAEPAGAFYVFFTVDGVTDSTAFTARLLEETGVALAPGDAFGEGGDACVRLCFAVSEAVLSDALGRLARFMASGRAGSTCS
jgi:aspartate/methionine/tyrosine aminotransferase